MDLSPLLAASPVVKLHVATILSAAVIGAAQLTFAQNVWLPLVAPMVALATSAVTVLLFRYWVVDRDGRRIRMAFRQYLAPELVAELATMSTQAITQITLRLRHPAERLMMIDSQRLQRVDRALLANAPRLNDRPLKLPPILP